MSYQGESLWLSVAGRLSKWDFEQGHPPDELQQWVAARVPDLQGEPEDRWLIELWEPVVEALVRERLLPLLPHAITLSVGMNHNPVQFETVDGVEVKDAVFYGRAPGPVLGGPEGVWVPFGEVVEVARRLAPGRVPVLGAARCVWGEHVDPCTCGRRRGLAVTRVEESEPVEVRRVPVLRPAALVEDVREVLRWGPW